MSIINGKILEGANPKTIERVRGEYLKDDKNVFFRNKKMGNVDVKSFKVLNEYSAKDKNNVYIGNSIIGLWKLDKIENPETFEFLSDTINADSFYGKDKYNVYYVDRIWLDSFVGVYIWMGFKVKGINTDKVKFLNKQFIKDDKNIYFEGKILKDADYNTFEVDSEGNAKDKNRNY